MFKITSTFYKCTAAVATRSDDEPSWQQTVKKQFQKEDE